MRMRMSANALFFLEKMHFMPAAEEVRGGHPRDSGTDHGNAKARRRIVRYRFQVSFVLGSLLDRFRRQLTIAQLARQSTPTHDFQRVKSGVNLPPAQPLAAAMHEAMMVVMPSFAHRNQREEEVIAALIR